MAKKVYAIKEGFDFDTNEKVENKIVSTWTECLKYVKGVKGAQYKSFTDINDAEQYLTETGKLLKKGIDTYPEDCLHIYVDGSYSADTRRYSYGVVAVRNNVVEYIESDSDKDSSENSIRQIAGELGGAIKGVEYALSKGDKKLVLFHDYEGISHHATGLWKRREPSSMSYYDKMNNLMSKGIEVIFVKVDSHTGDLFNELVDEKCKERLSIPSDKIVEKWLLKNTLNVSSEEVKQEIITIAPKGESNIKVLRPSESENKKDNEINKFSEIIHGEKLNSKEINTLIDNLNCKEKTGLILYLLNRKTI